MGALRRFKQFSDDSSKTILYHTLIKINFLYLITIWNNASKSCKDMKIGAQSYSFVWVDLRPQLWFVVSSAACQSTNSGVLNSVISYTTWSITFIKPNKLFKQSMYEYHTRSRTVSVGYRTKQWSPSSPKTQCKAPTNPDLKKNL